ncbi:Hypothetical protein PENO1_092960 [Penicillium occitanis (nom. inval.)]|nr:Hypothetical protein PENO1_092960 [Penicillium occitanis (nom. inval.)]PCG92033.1 hypothetical protein PENOC_094520 [Penicillium occitanis (nom. inval.)]
MGYTHYYKVKDWSAPEWQTAWPQLIQDTSTIIDAVPAIPLSGPASVTFEEGGDIPNPPTVDIDEGICINGVEGNSYEDFILKESEPMGFCKTGRRAYDLVVTCVLLRAYRLAPNTFSLSSDGCWNSEEEWVPARALYHDIWPDDPDEKPPDIYEREDEDNLS